MIGRAIRCITVLSEKFCILELRFRDMCLVNTTSLATLCYDDDDG